jgi:Ankyrin repeats (3 copies)
MSRDDRFLEAAYNGNAGVLEEMIKRLDPNEPKRYGNMALHIVSRLGHEEAVKTLLTYNVDITTKTENPSRMTALRIAVENLRLKVVELLLKKGAPIDLSEEYISTVTNEEIRILLKNPPLIEGPHKVSSKSSPQPKGWKKRVDPRLPQNSYGGRACEKHWITVADFYVTGVDQTGDASQSMEKRKVDRYTVHDALYTSVLADRKPSSGNIRPKFTWYHVPANNVSSS